LFFNSFWVFQCKGWTDGESEIASMNVPMVFGFLTQEKQSQKSFHKGNP
jgi:hypothetical protein